MGLEGRTKNLVLLPFGLGQRRHIYWQGRPGNKAEALDELIEAQGAGERPWRMEASIDLFGCDPATICSGQKIRAFAVALCDCIHMRRSQGPLMVHFGAEERVSGFTLVQLIETSAVSGHFVEQVNAACRTIFSCAAFRPYATARFCQEWFGAKEVQTSVAFRGPAQGKCPSHGKMQAGRPGRVGGDACSLNS